MSQILNNLLLLMQLGFTTFLTSKIISVAFYSEREKSDKFCSEALRHGPHGFTSPPKEVVLMGGSPGELSEELVT